MEKFTKNQIEIEAEEYTGKPEQLIRLETDNNLKYKQDNEGRISVLTHNGNYTDLNIGDYIIIGINGEFNVMNADGFNKMYSPKHKSELPPQISSINLVENQDDSLIPGTNEKLPLNTIITVCTNVVLISAISIFLFCFNKSFNSNIQKTVEEANKIAIEKASNDLLILTKLEAEEIINNAKAEAKLEADKTFREEMKRLTEEKIGK